jgi:hypothetical protein
MNETRSRNLAKEILGKFPFSARFYQALRPEIVPTGAYGLEQLLDILPSWVAALQGQEPWVPEPLRKRVLIIGSLKWWLEYGIALGMLLKSGGHDIDLAYLPYRDWTTPVTRFDALRGAYYIAHHLRACDIPFGLKNLLHGSIRNLEQELHAGMEAQAKLDVQYTLQREEIHVDKDSRDSAIYQMRLDRNLIAAAGAYAILKDGSYDVVIIPNGSILEFGAIYRVARHLGTTAVTYEFGEQRERVWLAQNSEVMRQDTSGLWQAVRDIPLTPPQQKTIEKLFQVRRGGVTWEQFSRRWQTGGGEGAQQVREKLALDANRPIVLLCTNVVGDSLALNRQIFTDGMADWLSQTVNIFSELPEYQLLVRVHPGEMLGAGHPSVDIIRNALPHQPEHVVVVPPESEINTYDLIDLAHLGLVYTTTFGLELSMHGIPVIVAGETHYGAKGFTDDPQNWAEYSQLLESRLGEKSAASIPEEAMMLAWRYAYRYFFDYPFIFPWHLISFWQDLTERPFEEVIEPKNREPYQDALNAFVGQPIDWRAKAALTQKAEVPVEG